MQIPSYQIQNVLKVYSRQFSQGKLLGKNKFSDANKVSADSVSISSEGKRQAIIDKVASSIVDKIINEGPNEKDKTQITDQIEKELGKRLILPKGEINSLIPRLTKTIIRLSRTYPWKIPSSL